MEVIKMKKFCVALLFSFIILVFTGCSKEPYTFKQALDTYGTEYEIVNIDNSNFLIKWENVSMIFKGGELVQVVKVK